MAKKKTLSMKSNGLHPTTALAPKGPVDNLEEHVPADWWRSLFNSTYLKTDGDVVDDRDITINEVHQIISAGNLQTSETILDLCCGQGRHTLELMRQGYTRVQGLDRSRYLINRARRTAKNEGLDIRFREGDARKLPYSTDTFDVVMILGNSFGYFTSIEDDRKVLKEVMRVLKPSGRILLDVTNGDYMRENYTPRSWEWLDKDHLVCRERSLSSDEQRLISREIVIHNNKGTLVDQFYAERLYGQEMFEKLLASAGFISINTHNTLVGQSTRNQDLGMMAHRLIISGRAKKDWSPVKTKHDKNATKVTVVMGDPRKKDTVKPTSTFDDDDFYTIDRLKDALRDLESCGYAFTYLDNHDTLIPDLLSARPELVFNLCDEGFSNDAKKELHVPALMEMLNIPYTGGTPQCLSTCYDKSMVRGIASEMGIPVPMGYMVKPDESTYTLPISFPVIVKPILGDSSVGIRAECVVNSVDELTAIIADLHRQFNLPVLVEEFLTGDDLTIGIVGQAPDEYRVFPLGVTDYSTLPDALPQICGYESKWEFDSPYFEHLRFKQAHLSDETQRLIIDWSLQLKTRLECHDYVRLDWRLDRNGNPKLLEVNPNPGWCWDGHLNEMAKFDGHSYTELLQMILRSAELRYGIAEVNSNGHRA